jgi:hypothetical protein
MACVRTVPPTSESPILARSRGVDTQDDAVGVRVAVPLSLLFASLVASCNVETGGGPCGSWIPVEGPVAVTEGEFQWFARDDGVLDTSECLDLCACLAPSTLSREGGTVFGADARNDQSSDDAADKARDDAGVEDTGEDGGDAGPTADTGTVGPRCTPVGGIRASRFTECADRGATAEGHTVHCKGERHDGYVCGRSSAGHESVGRGRGDTAAARWLAFAAATEAASIRSFLLLTRELSALGAPADLASRAYGAAREEARHARWMGRLARDEGGRVERPRSVRVPLRDLEAVATENAVEGCVYETWAALLNHHQAAHAMDVKVRTVMARIAIDETAHAELAHDIDRWAMAVLPSAARRRVRRAKRAAARALATTLPNPTPLLCASLGLPSQRTAKFFAKELKTRLWS